VLWCDDDHFWFVLTLSYVPLQSIIMAPHSLGALHYSHS